MVTRAVPQRPATQAASWVHRALADARRGVLLRSRARAGAGRHDRRRARRQSPTAHRRRGHVCPGAAGGLRELPALLLAAARREPAPSAPRRSRTAPAARPRGGSVASGCRRLARGRAPDPRLGTPTPARSGLDRAATRLRLLARLGHPVRRADRAARRRRRPRRGRPASPAHRLRPRPGLDRGRHRRVDRRRPPHTMHGRDRRAWSLPSDRKRRGSGRRPPNRRAQ